MASPGRKFRDEDHGLRILLRSRSVLRFHLLPDGPRFAATSSSSRTGAGWPGWTRATRSSASGLAAEWKTHSACRSATIGSTTAFIRIENRVRVDKTDSSTGNHFARDHASGSLYGHASRFLCGKQNPVGGKIPLGRWPCAATCDTFRRHQPGDPGQFRHSHQVAAQPKGEFDLRPVGQYGVLCTGRIQFSLATTGAAQPKRWNRFRRKILIPIRPSTTIPPLIPTKGGGSRRAHYWPFRICKAPFRSGISTVDSELQQSGDTGGTTASRQPSNRYGVEWANYYTPLEHLAFDFDLANSKALFTAIDRR